ncbi:cytochrome b [Roseibium sp.]|uniref:cytochrome b n=1 Tax=Roseibium sp. TaxID=1936156 RepID=UPI003A988581
MQNSIETNPPASLTQPPQSVIRVERYPATSRMLHWAIAALVLATWPLGFVIHLVKGESQPIFYALHEGLGFLVIWLMLVRVGNKLLTRSPIADGPTLEKIAAHTVHGLLYVFLIIQPVSGFLATNAHGFPLQWFGLVEIWSPIGKSPDIAWTLSGIHTWSGWILLGLFALHIGAVLMHHVIKRDVTLYRIL